MSGMAADCWERFWNLWVARYLARPTVRILLGTGAFYGLNGHLFDVGGGSVNGMPFQEVEINNLPADLGL